MKYKLNDLLDFKTQGVNTTTDNVSYVNSGYKIVQAKNIEPYNITFDDTNFIDSDTFDRIKENHKLHKGEVLYTNIGSQLGNSAIYDYDDEAIITWNVMKLIPKKEIIDNNYLCYLLNNNKMTIKALNTSSTMPFVSGKELMNVEFEVPELDIQKKVVKILKKIEDKIKLNNIIANNLDEFANNYFDKIYRETSNEYYYLENYVTFSQGKQVGVDNQSLTKESNMKRFLRIIDFTNPSEPIRYVEDFGDRYYAKLDDIIMIRYGSQTCGKVVRGKEGIIANNMFKINMKDYELNNYIYYYLKSKKIQSQLTSSQNSSTMPSINFGIMNKLEIKIPPKDIIIQFNKIIEPIRLLLIELANENEKMNNLRDTLLPKLINGEINLDKIDI